MLPETVSDRTVPEQFAGTIFDVMPSGSYDVELEATAPDGGGETRMLTATTRAWPKDPAMPHAVAVANATELRAYLQNAQPGDILTLADPGGDDVPGKGGGCCQTPRDARGSVVLVVLVAFVLLRRSARSRTT